MTSSGYRSPARMPAGLAILIFTAASVLPQACAHAESVFGRNQPSARIYALGSRFAGIIPDQLTDLTLNPAHAWGVESLTINYGFRNPYGQSLPFPIASEDMEPDFHTMNINGTNEIRLFGVSAWGWKWAFDTEWELYHRDNCNRWGTNGFDRNWQADISTNMREECVINDNNYFRLDIASARSLGNRTVLGLRAGGTFRYYNSKWRDRHVREEYEYDGDTGEYLKDYGRSNDYLHDNSKKLFTGYLEAGMTWKDSGELVVRGGYAEGTHLRDDYNLSIQTGYDNYTWELDDYNYRLQEFREARDGDTWKLSAFVKKRYSGGFVIFAAGGHERGSYESDWRNSYTLYSWGSYDDLQIEDEMWYPGEGTRTRSEAVFRIGKTYALERRIDLTPGVHVGYKKERFEESGEAGIYSYINDGGTVFTTWYRLPVSFERTESWTELVLPLAIEFRAASFFHLYSGFGMSFTWNRDVTKHTSILQFGESDDALIPEETETENNRFDTGYYATLGFSLRYRDKLFLDMYTGSDIVPERITQYIIDLRYVF